MNKYNVKAAFILYQDIFPAQHDRPMITHKAFLSKWKRTVKKTVDLNDRFAKLRINVVEAIEKSPALLPFLEGSIRPNKKLAYEKCRGCRGLNYTCFGVRPCQSRTTAGKRCVYEVDDHITIEYYPPTAIKPIWLQGDSLDPECCYTCDTRARLGRKNYDGNRELPCNNYVEFASRGYPKPHRCKRPLPDGGYICYAFDTALAQAGGTSKRDSCDDDYSSSSDSEYNVDEEYEIDPDLKNTIQKSFQKSTSRINEWSHSSGSKT